MSSTGIKQEPSWDWSSVDSGLRNRAGVTGSTSDLRGAFTEEEERIKREYRPPSVKQEDDEDAEDGPPPEFWQSEEYAGDTFPEDGTVPDPEPEPMKTWPSRQCRICLEIVPPTVHTFDALPGFMRTKPRVTYLSEDPTLGRLIRPCKCKGSSRYVHEGCLQQWRISDMSFRSKHYWNCPTCGFQYRLARMAWSRWIKSTAVQVALTVAIFVTTIFVLGFVADPIINFYIDPVETITSPLFDRHDGPRFPTAALPKDEEDGWIEHFIKGLASLGLLGFIKMFFSFSPWNQWSMRNSGAFSNGGRGRTGRERLSGVTWVLILTGVVTFLWTVWKGVRAWSRRTLEQAADKVVDVPLDDDEEELVDVDSTPAAVPSDRLLTKE